MKLDRSPFHVAKELTVAYDEYVALLEKAESGLIGLAYAHGYRSSPEQAAQGKALREKIGALKAELDSF